MVIKELELLDLIEREGDRANESMVAAKAGGPDSYKRYFGENGALTKKRITRPHPITGINHVVEIVLVQTWWEDRKKLHGRTEDGKRYQKMLRDLIYYYEPYSEVSGGKLQREDN